MSARTSKQPIDTNNVISLKPEMPNTALTEPSPVTIAINQLPDLSTAIEEPIELGYQYWTPINIGEYKRGVVINIENSFYEKVDDKTNETTEIELPCVIFAEQKPDGSWINRHSAPPPAVKNNINCAKQLFGLDDKQ